MSDPNLSDATVQEIMGLIARHAVALAEVGRCDEAEHCHAIVLRDGRVQLSYRELQPRGPVTDPDILKALSLDPIFEIHEGAA